MCAYNTLLGSADICPQGTADPNIGSFHAIESMRACILCRKHLKHKEEVYNHIGQLKVANNIC